ncbi:MAG: hypothetical protein Q7T11_02005 [Deltaproteobacteria bacterium]|nr:hypothetical protein [Deltaproteobacteria bacterium]
MRKTFLILALLAASCDSGGNGEMTFQSKNLALTVTNSRSFNPDIIHGKIDHYQITVTGTDLNIPFTTRIAGESASATMMGIPTGTDRTITIEAFNPNSLVIRRGKKEGVSIIPGQFSHVEIAMLTVPIFTNVADRGAVSNSRLDFEVFGEPDSKLGIYEMDGEEEAAALADFTGRTLLNTKDDEGLFIHSPGNLSQGLHAFKVADMETGESSSVRLTVYEATTRPGIALNSGGKATRLKDELVLSGVGQAYHRDVKTGGDHLGNDTMLDVVEAIY